MNIDFGPQSANGVHATKASVQESAGINDSGGGSDGGAGGLLATFCGAFCKDNPLGEQFGVTQAATAPTTQSEPITSQSKTLTGFQSFRFGKVLQQTIEATMKKLRFLCYANNRYCINVLHSIFLLSL